ncbi:MAG: DUF2147 domain-containing protein [Pseudomonadales bacterium]|jgi:uncharacterized protein (DUF2147 family)|nr:DUF2147 domain-containing protein [Pseudomonadales bacterium]MDP6471820.1 DUF2147 domain-containing protein [Pseudomonadales bacterium]MDP6828766.1 DUF2147 domain-containing protein [Pseudomonadales bacterium]MDP6970301.1 DUF2147 domain-containing protein [Pseudomonadales bacterium]|tara:strand:+ start:2487 stop:2987 length:501 start_codon:yes stop_codon:yes gene_type:complete
MNAWWRIMLVIWLASIGAAAADDRRAVYGRWASEGSIIEVSDAAGTLSARVIALKDPGYLEGEEYGPVGTPRRDDLNPAKALRTRAILGMELLTDYEWGDDQWQGRIYDPESGKTYSSKMWREGSELHMRGYIGFSLLGRTAVFLPVASCAANIPLMLENAELTGC